MRLDVRPWHLLGAAVFVGVFVLPMLGIGVYGIRTMRSIEAGAGVAVGPRPGFVLVEAAFAAAVLIAGPGLALSLAADAREIAGEAWQPSPWRYGALGLLYPLSLLVAAGYLYCRSRRVGVGGFSLRDPVPRERLRAARWWYLVAFGPVLYLAGFGVLLVPGAIGPTFLGDRYVRVFGLALLSGTGLVGFGLGLAADLRLVRAAAVPWTPGTRRYMVPTVLVPGLLPLVGLVYLRNRHRHVGVP